ncbi:MAG TPA: SprT family zinc-dependent metalloprotease [Casimicrobiaceae bacterium]|nr:SprT family zinc-dependent metalloprotease [Casimicrobiaceae bacterium]
MTRMRLGRNDAGSARRISLKGAQVDFRLVRTRRRTIGMEIDLAGLTVRAPRWVTIGEIEEALHERSDWLLRTLDAWRGRRRDVLPHEWRTGARILYGGHELTLAVYPARRPLIRPDLFDLTILHPHAVDSRQVASFVMHWLRDEALRLVVPQVARFTRQLKHAVPPVKISNARGEWGSCNHKGEIRLNWRLVQLPRELAEYVVAHEVAHLHELNHSPRFWAVVETLLPAHATRRRALDEWSALLHATFERF